MPPSTSASDRRWAERWRRRWDRQQERYLPEREERFAAILDVLDHTVATDRTAKHHGAYRPFRFLDLGGGSGSLAERILERFAPATGVVVDFDPVLMRLGRTALGGYGPRLTWVEADLRSATWPRALPPGPFDLAVSTTALHWLRPLETARLYRSLGGLLRPGGVFVNGDSIGFPEGSRRFRRLAHVHRATDMAHSVGRGESWDEWWRAVLADRRLVAEAKLRAERVPAQHERVPRADLPAQRRMLAAAGFRESEVVWSQWENRVLVAIR
jgi:SAM-dependent methyltransferase